MENNKHETSDTLLSQSSDKFDVDLPLEQVKIR